ncbi:MAG TPA: response regulator transcription factor [Ignavibacteriales bacterium]|nr:response regulator transcription factor [Ignavibacteriales bacterium]
MKIKCIAIDDEPLALEKLSGFIKDVDFLELLAAFSNPLEALSFIQKNRIDLVFLDIRMKKLSGLQFLQSLNEKPKVIITSAYRQYALQGFELEVKDYLLKPFSFDRFLKAVSKVYSDLSGSQQMPTEQNKQIIFIKTEYRIEKVELSGILYIEGMNDYLSIATDDKKIMTLLTFNKLLELLPSDKFCRVHKSFVVAISRIENIERDRIKIGDAYIPISTTYKNGFIDLLKQNHMLI